MQALWHSKLSFHAWEMRSEQSLIDRLVVMCCLKESEDATSFLFAADNTLVEDLIAHYGISAAVTSVTPEKLELFCFWDHKLNRLGWNWQREVASQFRIAVS